MTVRDGHAVVTNVPYVDHECAVRRGALVIPLSTTGDRTGPPPLDLTGRFAGAMPCHSDGSAIERIVAPTISGSSWLPAWSSTITSRASRSHRAASRTTTSRSRPTSEPFRTRRRCIHLTATAATFAAMETEDDESVFRYYDSASSRAGIMMATAKLEQQRKVAILGVGGTGSYVLDLVAKTPVGELHIFDGDELLNHKRFRSPGAVSLAELRARPLQLPSISPPCTAVSTGT